MVDNRFAPPDSYVADLADPQHFSATRLETVLKWCVWANLIVGGLIVLVMSNSLLAAPTFNLLLLAVPCVLTLILAWWMRLPSCGVLRFGTYLYGVQCISLPSLSIGIGWGMSIDLNFGPKDDPVLHINLVAIVLTMLFVKALRERRYRESTTDFG